MIGSRSGSAPIAASVWSLLSAAHANEPTLWHWEQRTTHGALIARSACGFTEYVDCLVDAVGHGYWSVPRG
jgi:hypothetical protein